MEKEVNLGNKKKKALSDWIQTIIQKEGVGLSEKNERTRFGLKKKFDY